MKTPPPGSRIAVAALIAVVVAGSAAMPRTALAAVATDVAPAAGSAGMQARDLFQAQRYADALAIYQRLHTETHHPTYLRNIGRCHQMMRQPAPAIDAFRAYLRDARDLGQGERTEIEGYIAEMQRLEVSAQPPPAAAAPALVVDAGAAAAPGRPAEEPLYRRWWFWTGIGVLAVTAGIVAVAAASSGQERLPCPQGAVCPP
jgi:hypothetical protein